MATALLVPVTFYLSPIAAIATIIAASAMAIFSGDIPGCLLRIPGTPASAAYTDEAYAMTRKGQAEMALGIGLWFSRARRHRRHAVADAAGAAAGRDGAVLLDLRVFLARLPRPDVRDAGRALLAGEGDRLDAARPAGRPASAWRTRPARRASPSARPTCSAASRRSRRWSASSRSREVMRAMVTPEPPPAAQAPLRQHPRRASGR